VLRGNPTDWAATWRAFKGLDVQDRLATLEPPTLVLGGEADAATILEPEIIADIAKRIPGASYQELPGAPHMHTPRRWPTPSTSSCPPSGAALMHVSNVERVAAQRLRSEGTSPNRHPLLRRRMRFLRVGPEGAEVPAVLDETGVLYDLSTVTADIDGAFLATDPVGRVRDALASGHLPVLNQEGSRIGAPVVRPGKVVCIGLNYRDHAAETGAPEPAEPIVFMKASNTVIGPDDTVLVPRGSTKTDYEVELAIVIGRTARYLDSPDDAEGVIAGYTIADDVSEREFQLERGGQWTKGKSCETFNPLGPWLVTPDETGDPQALGLRLWVNGELRQDGHTKNMIFTGRHLVWYLSQFMVLEPGDVIITGTPAGVALGGRFEFLRAGDVVELEIDRLGRQRHVFGQA
jgi:2-keto-4-pentenoate hydratase/2-oxohepta-3-ene-1,7-dioic acid hydratase in catechol pathway